MTASILLDDRFALKSDESILHRDLFFGKTFLGGLHRYPLHITVEFAV